MATHMGHQQTINSFRCDHSTTPCRRAITSIKKKAEDNDGPLDGHSITKYHNTFMKYRTTKNLSRSHLDGTVP
ncbi:hypothetical protein E2C01_008207 [Portunus trituberculatus]|uniref:Uncharacterized protein n=1 Tax=Portunus trituberculatus TaxID=210409 RepID=A0A5B7D466_PORTR|nr:hypothetical protein [Portunus trituberculatus]